MLPALPALQSLDLSKADEFDMFAKALAPTLTLAPEATPFSRLTHLSLSDVFDLHASDLLQHGCLPNLHSLNLADCGANTRYVSQVRPTRPEALRLPAAPCQ